MDDARALAGHWWPEYRWDDATAHRGAFHDVLVLPGHVVARMAKQPGASTRLAVEHRTLTRLAARGRWAIPAALGNLRTADDGRAGMLTSWLPGTHRDEVAWADVAHELAALIAALATGSVLRATGALPPPRTWCGGSAFPGIVRTDLVPLLAPADGAAAEAAVTRMLSTERGGVLVHGDLGLHNILWDDSGRVRGLIDLDHAAIGDPAIDVAPLLGRFGTTALGSVVGADVLRRAMIHRATLPLQVAAAATIVGDHRLRDTALQNFTRRRADGTLHDPDGTAP